MNHSQIVSFLWAIPRNWRIIFRFHDGDAYDVDLMDYHQILEMATWP